MEPLYFIIKQNGKPVECYNMTNSGPMFRAVGRDVTKRNLKKGQTFEESTKPVKVKPVKAKKPKQANIVASAMNFNVDVEDTQKIGFHQGK